MLLDHPKLCSQGNRAIVACLFSHKIKQDSQQNFSHSQTILPFLCNKMHCRCRMNHSLYCSSQRSKFGRFDDQENQQFVFIDDQLRQLNFRIKQREKPYIVIYKKELLESYDRMIRHIETEREELLELLEQKNIRLFLADDELKVYNQIMNQHCLIQSSLSPSKPANFKSELKALQKKLSTSSAKIENTLYDKFKQFRQSLLKNWKDGWRGRNFDLPELDLKWDMKRQEIKNELMDHKFLNSDINVLELNGDVVKEIPSQIRWEEITALDVMSISNDALAKLCKLSKNLRQLTIHNKISISKAQDILMLSNLEKLSIQFCKDNKQTKDNDSYDCDYCNERHRESSRERNRELKRQFENQMKETLHQLALNNPKLADLSIESSMLKDQYLEGFGNNNLKSLNIKNNKNISIQGFNGLCAKLTNLESLQVSELKKEAEKKRGKYDSSDSEQQQSPQRYQKNKITEGIINLKLQKQFLDEKPVQRFSNFFALSGLKSLTFESNELDEHQMQTLLKSFPALTKLSLNNTMNESNEAILMSLYLPNLLWLSVNHCYLDEEGLLSIAKSMKNLQYLSANENCFGDNGVIGIVTNLSNLRQLYLNNNRTMFSSSILRSLVESLPHLEQLGLTKSILLDSAQLVYLSKLTKLKGLSLQEFDLLNSVGFDKLSRNLKALTLIPHLKKQRRPQYSPFNSNRNNPFNNVRFPQFKRAQFGERNPFANNIPRFGLIQMQDAANQDLRRQNRLGRDKILSYATDSEGVRRFKKVLLRQTEKEKM